METTLQNPAFVAAKTAPKATTIVYWIVTALFCLEMAFTAYAQLRLPQVSFSIAMVEPGTSVGGIVNSAPRALIRS